MNNIGYFIYSHSEYDDIWDICFSRLKKHGMGFDNYYIFTNQVSRDVPDWIQPKLYTDGPIFTHKLKECLDQIEDDYVIYTHDDNFLKGDVNIDKIEKLKEILIEDDLSFIQLIRSGVPVTRFKEHGNDFLDLVDYGKCNLYYLQDDSRQWVGQPTLWNVEKLKLLLQENLATASTAKLRGEKIRDLESPETHEWMIRNNIRGCFYWNADNDTPLPPKNVTFNSDAFPTMNAIRKGKWYLTEHKKDIMNLIDEFKCDINHRGTI
jgi:hypothetical protein